MPMVARVASGRRLLRSNRMADEHSEPGGMKVLRLYADALGESRFETTTMPMALNVSRWDGQNTFTTISAHNGRSTMSAPMSAHGGKAEMLRTAPIRRS